MPTFCFSVAGHSARSVAEHLAAREIAVWWGNYYALETIRHLGLDEHDGAVRAGIVHYNTPTRSTGCSPRSRSSVEAPPPRRAQVPRARRDRRGARPRTRGHALQPGDDGSPTSIPELERITGDRDGGLDGLRGREWDAVVDTSGYLPRIVRAGAELLAASVAHYVFVSSISVYASFAEVVDESASAGRALGARLRERRAGLRGAQGALRGGCRGGVPRTLHRRPRRPDRRPARPDGPVHVLAAPDRPGRRPARPGACVAAAAARRRARPRGLDRDRGRGAARGAVQRDRADDDGRRGRRGAAGDRRDATRSVEVDDAFLAAQEVGEWMELPLWVDTRNDDWRRFLEVDASRAVGAGLCVPAARRDGRRDPRRGAARRGRRARPPSASASCSRPGGRAAPSRPTEGARIPRTLRLLLLGRDEHGPGAVTLPAHVGG